MITFGLGLVAGSILTLVIGVALAAWAFHRTFAR